MNLSELIAQREALERQQAEIAKAIADAQAAARKGVLEQIKTLMAQHGLTAADLADTTARKRGPARTEGKVAPKYRDPVTGNTWTGRGLKPRWMTEAIEAGKSKEDFAISGE